MVAVTEASVYHGAAPGVPSDISGAVVRFKRADNDAQDALDPVPIPSSGFNYSWRKSFKLRCPVTGPDNQITNLRFFSEGQNLGTDRILLVATAAAYVQGSLGDESTPISATDVDTYTLGSPLVVNAGQVFGPAETGDGTQDFVVLQARVGPSAVAGNVLATKGLVQRYDES